MWHPIETFPLDGNEYLVRSVYEDYTFYCVASYEVGCITDGYDEPIYPDEWTHIPE